MRPKTAQSFHPHEMAQTTTTGYIYILTNPSFPQYGKLGYATDVKQRPAELNRSTAVPFAFRVYATYEVDSALSDKKLHSILDKLNPDLRSAEEVDGKRRIREFYAMPPEDAYAILEAIAEINGFHHRLKKRRVTATAQQDEALARQIEEQHRERVSPFAFSKCGISEGAELEFCCRGNEQPASAAPSPTTSMCAFRTKYGPWPHWRSICWGPGIRSPGLSISNTTARG